MHYYQHHIGDFIKDTSFLTNEEVGIYMKLLWLYYDTELPLEDNLSSLTMKVNARGNETVVEGLLKMFFVRTQVGWSHDRCGREIAAFHAKKAQARDAGKASALKRAMKSSLTTVDSESNDHSTTVEIPLNVCATEVQPTNNHKPITNNQEPNKTPLPPKGAVDDIAQEFEEVWKIIPKRPGDSKASTLKAYRARRKDHSQHEIWEGVDRYSAFCKAQIAADPSWSFMKSAETFFGIGLHFQTEWDIPVSLKQKPPTEPLRQSSRGRVYS